jgi:RNA polymerase sigma-32 factor
LRFVVKIAYEYKGYGARLMDLIQEGSVGLMQAVKRFDPDKGVRLISYSVFWIRSYIHKYIMATSRMIKIGTSRAHRKLFFKLRQFKGQLGAGGNTENDKIVSAAAEKFAVKKQDIIEMDAHFSGADTSLDAPIAKTGTPLGEIIPANQINQEELIASIEQEADLHARLNEALLKLNQRERQIIEQRHLSEQPLQLKEIGSKMGISKQRVAQIEKNALSKLRAEFSAKPQ